ncbi:MAG: hypothetical protein EOO77_01170 [Oxalobacteraceae bacterium]|nr:MAG: hypothetical protein EOO77_01170 [Oxalobacteraceae bacterium]
MRFFRKLILGILVTTGAAEASMAADFIVVSAPRHPAVTNPQGAFRPDDPQLVGRIVSFSGSTASFDGSYKACDQTTKTAVKTSIGQLIRRIYPDRLNYGKHYIARPQDFGLARSPSALTVATTFRCVVSRGNHGEDWTGATLFPLGDGRWALSLIKDQLLILKPALGPVRASFDCAKARSAVERTICSDRLLAGWDRSVTAAYDTGQGDLSEQRAWLAERNKCGSNKECLHESMSLRTSNLLH